jgi:hypothetical protein
MQVFAMIFSQFTDTFGSPGDDFMSNVSKIGRQRTRMQQNGQMHWAS